jgi:CRP-like cAMP-binding protein
VTHVAALCPQAATLCDAGIDLFEGFNDEDLGKVADMLQPRHFEDAEAIIIQVRAAPTPTHEPRRPLPPPQPNPHPHITTIQGEEGHHFFILESGECVATIQDGTCSQEVKRYEPGELFGEKSLLESAKRAATITAVGKVLVWTLSRSAFELKLGMSHGRMWQM